MSVRIRKGSRLLCPECRTVKKLEFQNEKDRAFLVCGHDRTPGLLDPKPGHIGLEHLIAGDPLAISLFRAIDANGFRPRGRDISDILGPVTDVDRERWQWVA